MVSKPSASSARTRCAAIELALSLLLCLQVGRAPAAAQDPNSNRQQASEHFDRGLALVESAAYREAAEEFAAAYRLSETTAVLYNLGMAYAAAGQPLAAVATLERYLAGSGAELSQGERSDVEAELTRQRAHLGTLAVQVHPADAELAIDGSASLARTTLAAPVPLEVGVHRVSVTRDGYVASTRTVAIRAGQQTTLRIDLTPNANVAAPTHAQAPNESVADSSSTWRVVAYGLGGVGLATGIAALAVYLAADSEYETWKTTKSALEMQAQIAARRPPETDSALTLLMQVSKNDARWHSIERMDTTAIALGIGGVALVAGAAVLFVTAGDPAERPELAWNLHGQGLALTATY